MGVIDQMQSKMQAKPPMAEASITRIIDVWQDNFYENIDLIKALIPRYNYIAMDTEFPGVVEVPRKKTDDYQYQLCKVNVDTLRMIQLGITLFDSKGNVPDGP